MRPTCVKCGVDAFSVVGEKGAAVQVPVAPGYGLGIGCWCGGVVRARGGCTGTGGGGRSWEGARARFMNCFLTSAELKTYTPRIRAMARKVTIYLEKALRGDQMLLLAEHALQWGLQKARTRVASTRQGRRGLKGATSPASPKLPRI